MENTVDESDFTVYEYGVSCSHCGDLILVTCHPSRLEDVVCDLCGKTTKVTHKKELEIERY